MGSDLGPRLVAIMKKLGHESMKRAKTIDAIEQWRQERVLAGSKSANDTADCMRVLADHGQDLGQAISYAEHIFKQEGTIRLLTGHKSKGLEFSNVYFLDPHLLDDRDQDLNLRYVIQTRSQNSLMMLDSDTIRW
jgi:ATP-dependent exoDNAse (exonuclease V) beta subunit